MEDSCKVLGEQLQKPLHLQLNIIYTLIMSGVSLLE